ncbi:MAG: hypothetical protein M3O30_18315 [Planctomycetota bacterium]|nr:hypothetical protein [Planctomycetota bacterium]
MQTNTTQKSNRRAAGIALLLQLLIGIPIVVFGGGFLLLGTLFSDDPRTSYQTFLIGVGKYPLTFIISSPWALVALLAKRYRQSALVSVLAIGLVAGMLIVSSVTSR